MFSTCLTYLTELECLETVFFFDTTFSCVSSNLISSFLSSSMAFPLHPNLHLKITRFKPELDFHLSIQSSLGYFIYSKNFLTSFYADDFQISIAHPDVSSEKQFIHIQLLILTWYFNINSPHESQFKHAQNGFLDVLWKSAPFLASSTQHHPSNCSNQKSMCFTCIGWQSALVAHSPLKNILKLSLPSIDSIYYYLWSKFPQQVLFVFHVSTLYW